MLKFWMYYIIGALLLFHPHLSQKIGMLYDYFTHPEYQFWTTFSTMDLLDLLLHTGLPILMFILGARKQFAQK
jgi:hypothetical protein